MVICRDLSQLLSPMTSFVILEIEQEHSALLLFLPKENLLCKLSMGLGILHRRMVV
jgi:hypothetical protein